MKTKNSTTLRAIFLKSKKQAKIVIADFSFPGSWSFVPINFFTIFSPTFDKKRVFLVPTKFNIFDPLIWSLKNVTSYQNVGIPWFIFKFKFFIITLCINWLQRKSCHWDSIWSLVFIHHNLPNIVFDNQISIPSGSKKTLLYNQLSAIPVWKELN